MSESKLCPIPGCGAEMQATFDPFDNSRDGGLMCPMGDFGSCPRDTSDLIKSANRKADDLEAAGIPFDPEETK